MKQSCNYNFDLDLPIAQETERQIAKYLVEKGKMKFLNDNNDNRYDIKMELANGKPFTIEIKEDFTCARTGNVGVEFSCRGKPSGIEVSQADFYMYKVHVTKNIQRLYSIKTEKLKKMIEEEKYFRIVNGGDPGSNSMCYLFKLDTIIENFDYLGDLSNYS
jgi:hypothetical protein